MIRLWALCCVLTSYNGYILNIMLKGSVCPPPRPKGIQTIIDSALYYVNNHIILPRYNLSLSTKEDLQGLILGLISI